MGLQQSTLTRPPRQGGPGDDKVTDPGDDRVTVVNIDDTGGKQHDSQDKKIQGLTRLLTVNKTRSDDIYKDDVDHYEVIVLRVDVYIDHHVRQIIIVTIHAYMY